jgi:hypothetical protein
MLVPSDVTPIEIVPVPAENSIGAAQERHRTVSKTETNTDITTRLRGNRHHAIVVVDGALFSRVDGDGAREPHGLTSSRLSERMAPVRDVNRLVAFEDLRL